MTNKKAETLEVTLIKSPIGYSKRQRSVVQSLGLRKMGQTVKRGDTPVIRGMIRKVSHLLRVEKADA